MRSFAIIVLCIVGLTTSAQTTFEKIVPLAGAKYLSSVIQTTDGGYAAMGDFNNYGTDKWLVRTNAMGDTLWSRVYAGIGNNQMGDRYFSQAPDGGFTFLSHTSQKASLAHVNSNGDTLWNKELFLGIDYSLFPITDGYIIAGTGSDSTCLANITVCKVNGTGELIWKKTYLTIPFGYMASIMPQAIRETKQGGYIIAGNHYNGYGDSPFLLRIGPTGDSLWYLRYRVPGDSYGDAPIYSIDTTTDGGFVACGWININSTAFVMKVDNVGDTLWVNKDYLMPGRQSFYSVLSTADGGAVVCGRTNSKDFGGPDTTKVYLVKFSASGTIEWERKIATLGHSSGYCIELTLDHGYIICGYVHPYDTSYSGGGLLIKTDANGNFTGVKENEKLPDYKVFPNPASDHITFSFQEQMPSSRTITFYDLFGKEVGNRQVPKGQTEVTFSSANWKPGLYLYVIHDGSRIIKGKISIAE
jgi:hypothetical protein